MTRINMGNNKLIFIAIGIITVILVLGIIYMLYDSPAGSGQQPKAHNSFTDNYQSIQDMENAIETFAMSEDNFKQFLTSATAANGLTLDQRKEILAKLGCQTAIDQNMEGYRSLESGATFKVEKVTKTGESDKYIIHAADNLVLSVDPASGRLSRAVKNTNDPKQLFTKETVKDAAGADTNTVIFTKELASTAKLALQYEHESLSLRPLDPTGKPWRGQQFTLDANLKGELLDNAAMVLGYRLAPSVGGADLQNAGTVAMCGAGTGASTPLPAATVTSSGSSQSLSALTQQQINDIAAAVSANINAFNHTSGGAQPGTLNNPFANSPLKIKLDLSGLGEQSTTPTSAAMKGRVGGGFADIPRNLAHVEGFATMAGNEFKPGQIRDLIRAWDTTQPGAENTSDLGGLPSAAKSLGNALRGKMVSCPKIDRSQYYTERQLSQCLGCTPDALLKGELGGS